MKNLTLAIEDVVLEKARLAAAKQRTTVNAAVWQFLMEFGSQEDRIAKSKERLRHSWTSRQAVSARISNGTGTLFMTIECFLDTNILVYAAIGKRDEPAKFAGARDLLLDLSFGFSARRCSIP